MHNFSNIQLSLFYGIFCYISRLSLDIFGETINKNKSRFFCRFVLPNVSIKFEYRILKILIIILCIHSIVFSLESRAWQEPEPSHVTGMALAHCILDKLLGVVCHCFPPFYVYVKDKIRLRIYIKSMAFSKNCAHLICVFNLI